MPTASTRSAHFEINESATGLTRGAAEVRAQAEAADAGVPADHGGHIVAHRFLSDQGEINMFPQAGSSTSAPTRRWRTNCTRGPPTASRSRATSTCTSARTARPDSLTIDYVVTNPQTGEIVYWRAVEFQNQAGQTFDRVADRQIRAQHGVTHDLHVRPAADVPDGGD